MARPREGSEPRKPPPAAAAAAASSAARYRAAVLDRLPPRSLARLAALLKAGEPSPAAVAEALARQDGGTRLVASLRAADRRAFLALFRLGGTVLLLSARDCVPGASPDAARRSLGALLEVGLVVRLRVAGTLFLTIPPGLHDVVGEACRAALEKQRLLDDPPEALDPGPPLRAILGALLAQLERDPLRVTQAGTFFSRQVERIASSFRLAPVDQGLLLVLIDFLSRHAAVRLVDSSYRPHWPAARELLDALGAGATPALLAQHATRGARPLVRLMGIVPALDGVSTPSGWIPIEALVARDLPVLLTDGFEAPAADPGAMREDILARVAVLASGRLLDVAGKAPGAPPTHVRATDALRALLDGRTLKARSAAKRPHPVVLPSFEVLVPAETDGLDWATISQLAEIREADRVSRFFLSQARLYQALDAGPLKLDEILAFLESRTEHGLPRNVEQSIRSWAKGYGEIEFVEGLVARCRSEKAKASLLSVPGAVVEELSDGVYLLKPGCLDAVLKKAEADGHTPSRRVRRASAAPPKPDAGEAEPHRSPDPAAIQAALTKVPAPRGVLLVGNGETLPMETGPERPPPRAFRKFLKGVLGDGLGEFCEFVSGRELRELQELFLGGRTYEFEKKLDRILERYDEEERLRGSSARSSPPRSPLLGRPPSRNELLERLEAAVEEAADIEIEYREGGGAPKRHRVSPEEIVHRGVTPYLGAYCHETGEQRLFKLSLISRVRPAAAPEGEGEVGAE